MSERLTREDRLRLKREFDRLFQEGRVFHYSEMTVRAAPNALKVSRFGVSVGRRFGNAVRRNRVKRLLREAYRRNKSLLNVPCDVVVVPRPSWRELSYESAEPALRRALADIAKAFAPGTGTDSAG